MAIRPRPDSKEPDRMIWLFIKAWELFIWLYGPLAVVKSWKEARAYRDSERSAA